MSDVNVVVVGGRLGRDPELTRLGNGTAKARLRVALTDTWKSKDGEKQERTSWIDVELCGRQAETAAQYLEKGRKVMFQGSIREDTWEDKKTGDKRSKVYVNAERWFFADSQKSEGTRETSRETSREDYGRGSGYQGGGQGKTYCGSNTAAAMGVDEDDLPF